MCLLERVSISNSVRVNSSSTYKGNTMDLQSKNLETTFPQLPSDPDMAFLYLVLQTHLSHPIPSGEKKILIKALSSFCMLDLTYT